MEIWLLGAVGILLAAGAGGALWELSVALGVWDNAEENEAKGGEL